MSATVPSKSPSPGVQGSVGDVATASPSPFSCASCGAKLPAELNAGACAKCGATFRLTKDYVDFLPHLSEGVLSSLWRLVTTPIKQSLFMTGPMAYLYERGWRQNFHRLGFPGPTAEAELALEHVGRTGALLDVSCGAGVFTRELISGGDFDSVFGLDVSAEMLKEAAERDVDGQFRRVRADVTAMPFRDGTFDAVTAGAALHCWPQLQDGLVEVRRVLKDAGALYATTLGKHGNFALEATPFRWFEEEELVCVCKAAGFSSVKVEFLGTPKAFVVVRCIK